MAGPVTVESTAIALGLAQIRVALAATHIDKNTRQLTASDSIGSLASTKFTSEVEFFRHESGFPLLEDVTIPLREKAMLECAFEELTPANMALAQGKDLTTYSAAHSGEIALGALATPTNLRMEAVYTYPDGTNTMNIIFPRAQVSASPEIDLQKEDAVAVTVVFESKQADSNNSAGSSAWDGRPLGSIQFLSA